jgi:hypothetical protein
LAQKKRKSTLKKHCKISLTAAAVAVILKCLLITKETWT